MFIRWISTTCYKSNEKAQDIEINERNIDISVLGEKQNFEILKENDIKSQLGKINGTEIEWWLKAKH